MATQTQPEPTDNSMEKAVWGFIGTALTWISLLVSGVIVERLGLVGSLLPESLVAGETGQLRTDLNECSTNLGRVTLDLDSTRRNEESLRTNVAKLEKQMKESGPR